MGKGPRGGQERVVRGYEGPVWDANTLFARNAGNIMYGGDTSSPENYQSSQTGQDIPQNQAPGGQPGGTGDSGYTYNDGASGQGPDQYGFYNEYPEGGTQLRGKDRVHEVYRWGIESGQSPQAMLAKGGMSSEDKAYLQQLISKGDGKNSVAYQGWQPRPNHIPSTARNVNGQWVSGGATYGGGAPTGIGPGGVAQGAISDYGNIAGQFQNFANTGGYSPEDLANIRARAVSPIRSMYSSARRDLDRQKSLQGGYAPGYSANLAKMAREQSYAAGDASTNAESAIAQMVNQGKQFGVGGLASLYGTTPGMANMFGNQALAGQGLQNQAAQNNINNRLNASQLPGPWETTMGRIGDVGGMVAPFTTGGQFTNPFGGNSPT